MMGLGGTLSSGESVSKARSFERQQSNGSPDIKLVYAQQFTASHAASSCPSRGTTGAAQVRVSGTQ